MIAFAWYLFKVMLCSGILFGYYWVALRNKKFHHYNRFYLLISIAISWIIPLLKFDVVSRSSDQPQVVKLLSVITVGNNYVESTAKSNNTPTDWNLIAMLAFATISLVLLTRLLIGLFRIKLLINTSIKQKLEDIYLVFSNAKGTPFSFFKYIFWNENIKLDSPDGQNILKHELAHVKENHSADKLFINLCLIAGWFNPFLWLIKKEISMIHEFIADEKAIKDGDTAAFASMILNTAYTPYQFSIANPFFYSPIKRRLLMLTSSKSTRYAYLRKIAILPLLSITVFILAFKLKEKSSEVATASYEAMGKSNVEKKKSTVNNRKDTLKEQINRVEMVKENDKDIIRIVYKNGNKVVMDQSKMVVILNGEKTSWKKHTESIKEFLAENEILSEQWVVKKNLLKQNGEENSDGILLMTSRKKATQLNNNLIKPRFDKIFTRAENPPTFIRGEMTFAGYIQDNMTYPKEAIENKTEGRVIIKFIVDEQGNLSDFESLTSKGYGLENEAIRLIKNSGPWKPATQNGRKVAFEVLQKIHFKHPQKSTNGFIESLPKSNLLMKMNKGDGC
jgi:TonB family protein